MRRSFAALAAVLLGAGLALSTPASAETWRMAHKMPPDSVEGKLFQRFADLVEEYTNGELTVNVFPNEQLGKDDTVLEQLQIGTIHVYPEGGSYLQKWVPEVKWTSAPFLFDDREHWARFMQSELAQEWLQRIEDEAGVTVIGDQSAFVRGPYRVLVSKPEVDGLDDIEGLKLRMHPDELAAAAWRHLGAEVRTLPWTEVYESIDRGIVDAVNSPIALVEPMTFYEVAPNIARHNEYPQGIAFMTNARAFRALEDEVREAVLRAYDDAAAESRQVMEAEAREAIERMQAKGVTYEEIDTQPFVERMRSFYEEAERSGEMPAGFLEAVEATRAES